MSNAGAVGSMMLKKSWPYAECW